MNTDNTDNTDNTENSENLENLENLENTDKAESPEDTGIHSSREMDPVVRAECETNLAAAAVRLGAKRPMLQLVDWPIDYIDAENADDGTGPWVTARVELVELPSRVQEWAWTWAVAMSSLPPRPGWVKRMRWVDQGLEGPGMTTAVYTLAALLAVVAGAPVMWLAWIGIGLTAGIIAAQAVLAGITIRHEHQRVYAADQIAFDHGYPIPPETGQLMAWSRWTWPTSTLPGARARYHRQNGGADHG